MNSTDETQPSITRSDFDDFPKMDCPHQASLKFAEIKPNLLKGVNPTPCYECDVRKNNWMCLTCYSVGCSGFENGHMYKHCQTPGHEVTISLEKSTYWCYGCDSYVDSKELADLTDTYRKLKFPNTKMNKMAIVNALAQMFGEMSIVYDNQDNLVKFTREELIEGIKNKKFKRIIFLTGAGISVSAGIPDFRTPKTGLYDNLAAYNLPYPEAVFDIKYFRENPEPFYKLSKVLFQHKAKPTISHYFIKALADEGALFCNFTQNIDGLEVAAGVNPDLLVEAHGHYRGVHCIQCQEERSVEEFLKHIEEEKIYRCECGGLVKPDITFFGEALPKLFFDKVETLDDGDLVFVMGTSLKVFPFAALAQTISSKVPVVYINRENDKLIRDNLLFLQGDIDEQVRELVKDLGWDEKIEKLRGQEKNEKEPNLL